MFPIIKQLLASKLLTSTPGRVYGGLQNSIAGFRSFPTQGVLSSKEIVIYRKLFDQMDSNKDGYLTKEDLRKGLMDFVNYSVSDEELKNTMETLDSDGDGNVGFTEFISYVAWSRHTRKEEVIEEAFRNVDRDDDGLISKKEVREALVSLGVVPNEASLEDIVPATGKGQDGTLNLEEFRQIFHNKDNAE